MTPLARWAQDNLAEVVEEANTILQKVRVGKTSAERVDYQVAKRCVEQATLLAWKKTGQPLDIDKDILDSLLHEDFVQLGLDLEKDEFEADASGEDLPSWRITERTAVLVLGVEGSLWEYLVEPLEKLPRPLRVRVVEQLARYLTYKQVPFLAELLWEAKSGGLPIEPIESTATLDYFPKFWNSTAGRKWVDQMHAFLIYFLQRDSRQQLEILDGPIKTGDFARHTRDGESRERLREAFNTPLFPMVLVANEVMQEGLDLHKHCRRVMHHDLVWNPAQIEQRIGRIDRLGSLTNRLRKQGEEVTLDILYPVIRGTIDERLFRTVKTREKWLEFLLGAAPNFSEYSLSDEEPLPLPNRLASDLSINLAPEVRDD